MENRKSPKAHFESTTLKQFYLKERKPRGWEAISPIPYKSFCPVIGELGTSHGFSTFLATEVL